MPYTTEHKEQTRERIVMSARRLFNRRGFAEVSIDQIMEGAGLTRGGFYSHFKTKDDLYAEAVTAVMRDIPASRWEGLEVDMSSKGADLARQIVDAYLSRQHYDDVAHSCPMIALPSDVARAGPTVKSAFRKVLGGMVSIFSDGLRTKRRQPEETALALAAMVVGGMVLARAVDDETLADRIRAAAKRLTLDVSGW